MAKIQLPLTPYLWKTLFNLCRKYNCSIVESIRLSILIAGLMTNSVPEEGDDEWRMKK